MRAKKKGTKVTGKLPRTNDFCLIASDKKLKGSGLKRGDVVMIASFRPAPVSAKDPYLQRVFAIVFLSRDGLLQVPHDDNDYKAYLIDPRSLELLPDEEQEGMLELLRKQYGVSDADAATD